MHSDETHEEEPREPAENMTASPVQASTSPSDAVEESPVVAGETDEERDTAEAEDSVAGGVGSRGKLWAALALLAAVFLVALGGLVGLIHPFPKTSSSAAAPSGPATAAPVPTQPPAPTAVVSGGSVAAVVNGHAIPMSDYRLLLNFTLAQNAGAPGATPQALGAQVMNQVIGDELIRQYAVAHHVTVSSAEVDKAVQSQVQQLGSQSVFQQRLTQFGLTLATYRSLVTRSLLDQKVEQRVAPLQQASNKPVPVAHVRHILIAFHPQGNPAQPQASPATRSDVAAKAKALAVLKQLQHGASFATLAKKYSDDTGSASQGGDLGTIYPKQTVPQFDHAAFTLPLHHPAIVRSVYGYHIVEVLFRGKAIQPPQSQSQAAQQAQQHRFTTWLTAQTRRAKIQRIAKVQS